MSKINLIGLHGWIREQISNNFAVWIVAWKWLVKDLGFQVIWGRRRRRSRHSSIFEFLSLYICLEWINWHMWSPARLVAHFAREPHVPSSNPSFTKGSFCFPSHFLQKICWATIAWILFMAQNVWRAFLQIFWNAPPFQIFWEIHLPSRSSYWATLIWIPMGPDLLTPRINCFFLKLYLFVLFIFFVKYLFIFLV